MTQLLTAFLLLFFLVAASGGFWNFLWDTLVTLVVLSIAGAALLAFVFEYQKASDRAREPRRKAAEQTCTAIIRTHREELLRKQRQLSIDRGYGITDTARWEDEKRFFVENVLEGNAVGRAAARELGSERVSALFDRVIAAPPSPDGSPADEPSRYQQICVDLLAHSGWEVLLVATPGDRAADVLARKYGRTVVLQCREHAKAIGERAVREADTARTRYGADAAVVVSSAAFTLSGGQLAASNGVLLVRHDQLPAL